MSWWDWWGRWGTERQSSISRISWCWKNSTVRGLEEVCWEKLLQVIRGSGRRFCWLMLPVKPSNFTGPQILGRLKILISYAMLRWPENRTGDFSAYLIRLIMLIIMFIVVIMIITIIMKAKMKTAFYFWNALIRRRGGILSRKRVW